MFMTTTLHRKSMRLLRKTGYRREGLMIGYGIIVGAKKDAITIPPMKMKPFNEKYVKLAESNGISRDTFRLRVRHYGMSEYEAATKPLQDRKKQANIMQKKRKKYPDELLELAKKNGIKYTTFIARINRLRWDPLKAATTKRMEVSK